MIKNQYGHHAVIAATCYIILVILCLRKVATFTTITTRPWFFFFGNTHKKAKQEISLECSYIPSKDKTLIWRCTRIEYGQTYCTLATSNTLHHRQVAKWQCKCKDGHSHHYHSKDHTHIRRQCFILPAAYHRLLVYTELPSMQKPSPFLGL